MNSCQKKKDSSKINQVTEELLFTVQLLAACEEEKSEIRAVKLVAVFFSPWFFFLKILAGW
jgi:hypothetical protein